MSLVQYLSNKLPIVHIGHDGDKNELYTDGHEVGNDQIEKIIGEYYQNQKLEVVNVTQNYGAPWALDFDICKDNNVITKICISNHSGKRQIGPSWILLSEHLP